MASKDLMRDTKFLLKKSTKLHSDANFALVIAVTQSYALAAEFILSNLKKPQSQYSVYYKNLEIIKLTLKKGANIHNENQKGYVLERAGLAGNAKLVKLFLKKGANIHVANKCFLEGIMISMELQVFNILMNWTNKMKAFDVLRDTIIMLHCNTKKILRRKGCALKFIQ